VVSPRLTTRYSAAFLRAQSPVFDFSADDWRRDASAYIEEITDRHTDFASRRQKVHLLLDVPNAGKANTIVDLPMRDALGVCMHLHHARHQLGKIRDVGKEISHAVNARPHLDIVGVSRLYSEHNKFSTQRPQRPQRNTNHCSVYLCGLRDLCVSNI